MKRSDLTQFEALQLLRSEQMDASDYLALCIEKNWNADDKITRRDLKEQVAA